MVQARAKLNTKPEVYKNYIGGRWVKPDGGTMMENRNPADTRDSIGLFPASASARRRTEEYGPAAWGAPTADTGWTRW